MAWQPAIQVFDETEFKTNILSFLKSNQHDALAWANGVSAVPLEPIAAFYKSPNRVITVFPALIILQTSHKSNFNDILTIDLDAVFEVAVVHGKQDELADMVPKYSMALESMLTNVPETTFNQNSIIQVTSTIGELDTAFDVQGKMKNKFIEVFQTRATWRIEASAY